MSETKRTILYCHCAYSKIIAEKTKAAVLRELSDSEASFEAVADLCEMSARDDPSLARLASACSDGGELRIAACYPRAVRWLFAAGGAKLPEGGVDVRNMRQEEPDETVRALLDPAPLPPPPPKPESDAASISEEPASEGTDS